MSTDNNQHTGTRPEHTDSDKVNKSTLIIAIFLSIVGTFAALEMNGMIKHNTDKDDYPVAEFKAVFIEKQDDENYRLSHKPSNQSASCHSGYLFVSSDNNPKMQGLIVDYKNRGVKCQTTK